MNASERNTVEGVRVLWPTLSPMEKLRWASRLKHLFDDDWVRAANVLAGSVDFEP